MGKAIRKQQYSVPSNWTECYKLPLYLSDYEAKWTAGDDVTEISPGK